DGHLRLSPGLELLAKLDAPIIWASVSDKDGTIYFTTGGDSAQGELMKMTPEGVVSSVFKAEEPLLGALAIDAKGVIYFSSSPEGAVYRLLPGGKPEIFFRPTQTYIWGLLATADGRLFIATGTPKATIYCLSAASNLNDPASCVWFSCDQKDFTLMAQSKDGSIIAGTGSSGFLYRITQKNQAQVLAFTEGEEITGMDFGQDGSIYFCTFVSSKKNDPSKVDQAVAFMPKEGDKPGQPALVQLADKPSAAKKAELGSFYRIDPQGFVLPL
ncbi:MAG TPA: hypothetical protein PLV25_05625, partial [Opitutales bacterium]|nr:hypothetical protein [Opitutales bacterium]